jgi:hypothetical protein
LCGYSLHAQRCQYTHRRTLRHSQGEGTRPNGTASMRRPKPEDCDCKESDDSPSFLPNRRRTHIICVRLASMVRESVIVCLFPGCKSSMSSLPAEAPVRLCTDVPQGLSWPSSIQVSKIMSPASTLRTGIVAKLGGAPPSLCLSGCAGTQGCG